MWQVGVVFAALASFSGAAGDALVRLSFVLEAKRRRKQRQLLLLRQLQRSCSSSRSCRAVISTSRGCSNSPGNSSSPNSNSSSPSSSNFNSSECGNGSRVGVEKEASIDTAANDKKNTGICRTRGGVANGRYDIRKEEDEACSAENGVALVEDEGEEQGIFIPSRPFYLRPLWLLGTCLGTVINTLLSIISLDFASAAVVTPFAGLHIFWNVIFSRFTLQERVFTQHYVGSALVLFGLFFVLCYGAHTPPTLSLQQLLRLYSQNSCVIYFCLSALALFPCVYIGLFGKDVGWQHHPGQQREQQQQQQQRVAAQQHRRNKVLPYHAVGDDDFSGGLHAEENRVGLSSSSSREGAHEKISGVPPAARKPIVSRRRRSYDTRLKSALRHSTALSLVKEDKDGKAEGLSGRLCEALPGGGRSFSSFSCEDEESVCSASEGEGGSVSEQLDVAATDTPVGGPSTHAVRVHSRVAAVESETHGASRDEIAAEELHRERREGFSRQMPASGKYSVAGIVGGAALPSCNDCCTPRKEPTADPACSQFDKSSAYPPRGPQKRVKQTNTGRFVEGAAAARRRQQGNETAKKFESQRCLQHTGNNSSCLAIEIAGAEEKARGSVAATASDTSTSWEDVESGNNTGHHKRQKQQQHQQQRRQLQTQQQETGSWCDSLPAALYVEVPVALRRFCIAAASGACGGNTNIIMEHVMDVWHTESFATLLHPRFFLLLLLLGLMALGQLVFLNLGLARYEALYVVPTTMSVLIISSCLGEISVFIHVLELSQKEFFIFAGGALSIVSGIMVLSAADMERQQESSTVERLKEEDEQQSAVDTHLFEELPNQFEELSCTNLAEANKQRAFLTVPLRGERHICQERCSTTSTKCSRTNFSNPDGTDTADAAVKRSSADAAAAVERVDVAEKEIELDAALHLQACVEASGQMKTNKGRKERRQGRSLFKTQNRLSRSVDRALRIVPDAGVKLYSSAHLSAAGSQTLTGTVTPVQPSSSHTAAGAAAASEPSAVTRLPRSPTVKLLAAAAAVPQVLFSRLVRGSSRVVTSSDTNQYSSGRNRLRSHYQRLTRSGYSCAAAQGREEETCEVHSSRRREENTFSHLLADTESGCCTCQPDNVTPQEIRATEEHFVNTQSSSVC